MVDERGFILTGWSCVICNSLQSSDVSCEPVNSQKDKTTQEKPGSDQMVILVPVSVMDNEQANETITADAQCNFYDNSQVLPEQMMMMTVSEDELNTNQVQDSVNINADADRHILVTNNTKPTTLGPVLYDHFCV